MGFLSVSLLQSSILLGWFGDLFDLQRGFPVLHTCALRKPNCGSPKPWKTMTCLRPIGFIAGVFQTRIGKRDLKTNGLVVSTSTLVVS